MDTSMGFSPLSGVMMGTRAGDIDPTVLSHLGTVYIIVYRVIVAALRKSACLRIVCAWMNINLPWSGSRAQEYMIRHSVVCSQQSHD